MDNQLPNPKNTKTKKQQPQAPPKNLLAYSFTKSFQLAIDEVLWLLAMWNLQFTCAKAAPGQFEGRSPLLGCFYDRKTHAPAFTIEKSINPKKKQNYSRIGKQGTRVISSNTWGKSVLRWSETNQIYPLGYLKRNLGRLLTRFTKHHLDHSILTQNTTEPHLRQDVSRRIHHHAVAIGSWPSP